MMRSDHAHAPQDLDSEQYPRCSLLIHTMQSCDCKALWLPNAAARCVLPSSARMRAHAPAGAEQAVDVGVWGEAVGHSAHGPASPLQRGEREPCRLLPRLRIASFPRVPQRLHPGGALVQHRPAGEQMTDNSTLEAGQ